MSTLSPEEDQRWVPTHVQVTVLRARGLRGKGKHGTSDVYTIIQQGKEKYSTGVAEKTTSPEWKEECSFELQPGVLDASADGRSGYPGGSNELVLIVMHRALMGLDVFLGQAVIHLDKMFRESRSVRNEWYRLNSKTGKKEKERGDIQVTVQFTRNNLTASMYDLVMKDKGTSTFSKLKERMKGKRRASEEDSSSATLPGGYGSVYRMRQRLPSDGGGEEDYEDDEGGEIRRSKMRNFFLRGKLRKSSDTRSSTSLGSESSESSSRGGSLSPTAGISVVVSDLSNSPSNSSNLTADNSPEHTANTSPKLSSSKCEFSDEAGEITLTVPPPPVCINGSHSYSVQPLDPSSGKPEGSLGLGLLPKSMPLSMSLQNLNPRASADPAKSQVGDGRRWSFDKPGEEEKAAIVAALEQMGPLTTEDEEQMETAAVSQASSVGSESPGRNLRKNRSHGSSESAGRGQSQSKDESEQAPASSEERQKGWFRSKESHCKPSLVVSPKLEPSTDSHFTPLSPSHHPWGPLPHSVHPDSLVSPLHHTNPFCHSQTAAPLISPCNPFFTLLQHNPFYGEELTDPSLKPILPPFSITRPLVASESSNTNPTSSQAGLTTEGPNRKAANTMIITVELGSPPSIPAEGMTDLNKKLPNPFLLAVVAGGESEWDDSFEAFAAGRLQPPEGLTSDGRTRQNTPEVCPLTRDEIASTVSAAENTKVEDALHLLTSDVTTNNKEPLVDGETRWQNAEVFDTITEPNMRKDLLNIFLNKRTETKLSNCTTISDNCPTKVQELPSCSSFVCERVNLNSSPSNPGSSGVGSLAEDDFLSCVSSYSMSEKCSASSSDDAETQNSKISGIGLCDTGSVRHVQTLGSEDDNAQLSQDLSSVSMDHRIFAQHQQVDGSTGSNGSSLSVLQCRNATVKEGTDDANSLSACHSSDLQPNECTQTDATLITSDGERDLLEDLKLPSADAETETGLRNPSCQIMTSSPCDQCGSPSLRVDICSVAEQDTSGHPPFVDFLDNVSWQSFDDALPHSKVSNPSSCSLYVSVDSQHYKTCPTQQLSKCPSASETLHSANSTVYGEEIQSLADSILETVDRSATLIPPFSVGDEFGVAHPKALVGDNPSPLENPLQMPEDSARTLLSRSLSEGSFKTTCDDVNIPSFSSDPGVIPESFSAPPDTLAPPATFSPAPSPSESAPSVAAGSAPSLADASAACAAQGAAATPANANPMTDAWPAVLPPKTQEQAANQQNSPHPVKPLTTATPAEEKRTEGRSVLEKLRSTIHPGRSSQLSEQEADRRKCLTEGAGSYYHLTHSELVALLVQREADLARHRAEHEQQRVLLAKREMELKRLKPQIRDLEDYIDTLLVRIMEQKPTLLQVRSKFK